MKDTFIQLLGYKMKTQTGYTQQPVHAYKEAQWLSSYLPEFLILCLSSPRFIYSYQQHAADN